MTLWDRTHWQEGFPFSPTRLRPQALARPRCATEAVTAPRIPEAGTPPIPWAVPTDAPGPAARPGTTTPGAAPCNFFPHRPGLRLMPLAAFAWSGPGVRRGGTPALPRTRAEHLLIWLVSGRMRLQIARQATEMQPGSLRFIPAGTALAAHPLPGAEGHVLTIAPDLTADLDPALPRQVTAGHLGAGGDALLVTLRDLADEAARLDTAAVQHRQRRSQILRQPREAAALPQLDRRQRQESLDQRAVGAGCFGLCRTPAQGSRAAARFGIEP